MLPKLEKACFVIADISGYTRFLATTELEHAQDIIADLMGTIVDALRPPFRLAKFEGDAAFLYAVKDELDGSLLEDTIESAYFRFRRRMRDVKQASACTCSACVAMSDLDLKLVVHHGEMVKQVMAGREELAGRDVILVHRLLKNSVGESLGHGAYALYSDACIRAVGIDPVARDLGEHHEAVDIIGDVTVWARDLRTGWEHHNKLARIEVKPDESYLTWTFDIAAPRHMVWEYVTVPGQWQQWWFAEEIIEHSGGGRRGVGTTNHCMHGEAAVVEEILDWRPFDYFTIGITLPVPDAPRIVMTRAVTDRPDGGSVLAMRVAVPKPEHRAFVDQAAAKFASNVTPAIERFRTMLGGKQASIAVIDEPSLLPAKGRFLTASGAPG